MRQFINTMLASIFAVILVVEIPVAGFAAGTPYPPVISDITTTNKIDYSYYSDPSYDTTGKYKDINVPSTQVDSKGDPVLVAGNPVVGQFNILLSRKEEQFKSGTPVAFAIKSYSFDGGRKWRDCKSPDDAALQNPALAKNIKKGMTLWLSDQYIDKSTKKPPTNAIFVKFPTINKRPEAPKLNVNYAFDGATLADPSNPFYGEWALTESPTIYSTPVIDDILIGTESFSKESVGGYSFKFGELSAVDRIPVEPLYKTTNKKGQLVEVTFTRVYYIRNAAALEIDGTYTPASEIKKLKVLSQQKTPKYSLQKLDSSGKPKSEVLKLKPGVTSYLVTDSTDASLSGKIETSNRNMRYDDFKTIRVWNRETAKKPATALQVIKQTIP